MAAWLNRRKSMMLFAVVGVFVAAAVIAGIVVLLNQPRESDYQALNDSQLKSVAQTRKELIPTLNKYLADYKAAYNATGSIQSASDRAKPSYEAFSKARTAATAAIKTVADNRTANDASAGSALALFADAHQAEVDYLSGLVEDYPRYTAIFARKEKLCSDIFIGETSDLAERQQKLDQAVTDCYPALTKLQQSAHASYAPYAHKAERRIKKMQEYAASTAKAEREFTALTSEVEAYQKKVSEATARNASEQELNKLTAELKSVNARISESRTGFDFASKRYLSTVKEMPSLYSDVYDKDVPAKLKNLSKLIDVRTQVLQLVVDDKLTSKGE